MACKRISIGFFLFLLQCYLIVAQDKPCGDHDVKVNFFRNCPDPKNPNIKVQNLTLTLTDDCKLVPRGCFKVKKAIPAAEIEYYINKPPFKKKGTEDFCKMMASPEAQKCFEGYKNIPKKCTIQPGDYCINKGSTKIEQLNPKTLTLISGTTSGYFKIETQGSGDKACVEFKMTVTKKG